jgi:hypothetical protein
MWRYVKLLRMEALFTAESPRSRRFAEGVRGFTRSRWRTQHFNPLETDFFLLFLFPFFLGVFAASLCVLRDSAVNRAGEFRQIEASGLSLAGMPAGG